MTRAATVGAEYSDVIEAAADRLGDHEGMDQGRILRWMLQFNDADLPVARKVLNEITYFNANNFRSMSRLVFHMIVDDHPALAPDTTLFVPIAPDPGSGANIVARVLRALTHPFKPRVVSMVDLAGLSADQVGTIVFVDDFSGTGNTLTGWWEDVEPIIRPLDAPVIFAALVMTTQARERATELGAVTVVRELGPDANVLGDTNLSFTADEKQVLLATGARAGCPDRFLRGYGETGLLLAFSHGCPNNSLSLLWCSTGWFPLFLRQAI